jgi:hypothetical protein
VAGAQRTETAHAPDGREVALGVAFASFRMAGAVGRVAVAPSRAALRAPVVGHVLRRAGEDLASDGRRAEAWARARAEVALEAVLATPEVERAVDRVLAGRLTDAVARSVAEHRVVDRVAAEIVAAADVDAVIAAVLEHERTEEALDRALASPGLERLVVRILESRLVDGITERVLQSPEMDRVVEYIATSPQVVDAITRHTQTLAEEMVADVRRRTHSVDDLAERTVRGWLRRPRPAGP